MFHLDPQRPGGIEMFRGKEYGAIEGVGFGGGAVPNYSPSPITAPPQLGVWGCAPRKICEI